MPLPLPIAGDVMSVKARLGSLELNSVSKLRHPPANFRDAGHRRSAAASITDDALTSDQGDGVPDQPLQRVVR
jgi:hypothetical protein